MAKTTLYVYEFLNGQAYDLRATPIKEPPLHAIPERHRLAGTLEGITRKEFDDDEVLGQEKLTVFKSDELLAYLSADGSKGTLQALVQEDVNRFSITRIVKQPYNQEALRQSTTFAELLTTFAQVPVKAYVATIQPGNVHEPAYRRLVLTRPNEQPPFQGTKTFKQYDGTKAQAFTHTRGIHGSSTATITYAGTLTLTRKALEKRYIAYEKRKKSKCETKKDSKETTTNNNVSPKNRNRNSLRRKE